MGVPKATHPEELYDRDRVVVYVEGVDDVNIIDAHWVSQSAAFKKKVHIQAANGCKHVQQVVANDPTVFGLVDRDFCHDRDHWALFQQADDDRFRADARATFGERMHVLRLHEIENYLLTDLARLAEKLTPNGSRHCTVADAARELIRAADHLLPLLAAKGACFEAKAALDHEIAKMAENPKVSRDDQLAALRSALDQHGLRESILDQHLATLRTFDGYAVADEDRWVGLNRVVPGKEVFQFLRTHRTLLDKGAERELAHKGGVAPKEITDALDGFLAHARRAAAE